MKPVTLDDVEATIASEHYATGDYLAAREVFNCGAQIDTSAALLMLTVCAIVTRSGFVVTGESFCQDPAEFNAKSGRELARKAAIEKLFPMVVFERRQMEQSFIEAQHPVLAAMQPLDPEGKADVQDAA